MTKRLMTIVLMAICGALFVTTVIGADEAVQKEHAAIGTRAEPFEKQIVRLKAREEQSTREEKKPAKKAHSKSKKTSHAAATVEKPVASAQLSKRTYYTRHPGAYQNPVSVSYLGDSVELTDGSVWTISSSDAFRTINWFPSDLVVITPNSNWFSSYSFRLTNQATGDSVAANLSLGPIAPMYGSVYTHWIVAIDYYRNIVFLEDGSVWNMASLDSGVVTDWIINDVVIIGVNTGWLSSYNPNILINVNMLNYAAGASSY